MNVELPQAVSTRLKFETMYTDCGVRMLSDQAQRKLNKLKGGCLYRRELAALGPDESERRQGVLDLIALEDSNLWTLFET